MRGESRRTEGGPAADPLAPCRWAWLFVLGLALGAPWAADAQVRLTRGDLDLALEAYGNVTAGAADLRTSSDDLADDGLRADGAARAFARWTRQRGPDVGVRVVVEGIRGDALEFSEASVLLLGKRGRIEIGDRQGLPDVLLGYAPNNFTFTGAEFGPASGRSLDPAGGLVASFLAPALGVQLGELSVLGFSASLADDRSTKALYVSPKWRGWLGGISYTPEADDPRFEELVQVGLTHDTYWHDNQLHVGGSLSSARADSAAGARRDLRSVNLGATLVLANDWMLGASVTYDGRSGVEYTNDTANPARAIGGTLSLNYNTGPWTAGAFVQRAAREGAASLPGRDVLTAAEAGVSYRLSTRIRLFGAGYWFRFDDEGGASAADRYRGIVLMAGVRAAL